MLIYGRDDLEMLLLAPAKLITTDFEELMDHEFEKFRNDEASLAMIFYSKSTKENSAGKIRGKIRTSYVPHRKNRA